MSFRSGCSTRALWPTGSAFTSHCVNDRAQLRQAERWLRKQLYMGMVEADIAYLTRWNSETKKIELVVGTIYRPAKALREEIACSLMAR